MNKSTAAPIRFTAAAGMTLAALAVGASFFVLLAALKPFWIGQWYQSEPMILAFHLTGAAATGALLLLALTRPRRIATCVAHPFVALPFAIGFWAIAASPFAAVPLLSWFGSPQLGQGAIWYLSLASLTAAGMLLFERPSLRLAMGSAAVLAAVSIVTLNTATPVDSDEFLFVFTDFLAFYGIFITIIIVTYFPLRKHYRNIIAIGIGLAIILLSDNRSALVLAVTIGPIVWIAAYLARGRPRLARLGIAAVAVLIPVASFAALYLLAEGYIGVSAALESGWPGTISSRLRLVDIVVAALSDRPEAMLTGFGWGAYGDLLLQYLFLESVGLFEQGVFSPSWDAITRIDFHSHNYLVEALLSGGIVGLVLVWALPVSFVLYCRRRVLPWAVAFSVLYAGVSVSWFQFPGSVPFMAAAMAGIASPGVARRWRRWSPVKWSCWIVPAVLVPAFLAQIWGSFVQYEVARSVSRAKTVTDAELSERTTPKDGCRGFLFDYGRGGIHLAAAYRGFVNELSEKIDVGQAPSARDIGTLGLFSCASSRWLEGGQSLRLAAVDIFVRGDLAVSMDHPALDAVRAEFVAAWPDRLRAYLDRAPQRSDVASAYLLWLMGRGEELQALAFADDLLARDPDDRIGLWFSGIVLLGDPARAGDGMRRLKRSLDRGIDRVLPIDEGLRREIDDAPD